MNATQNLPTDALFDIATAALCTREWSRALAALNELANRSDVRDTIHCAVYYGAPAHLVQVLDDRIDWINEVASR